MERKFNTNISSNDRIVLIQIDKLLSQVSDLYDELEEKLMVGDTIDEVHGTITGQLYEQED